MGTIKYALEKLVYLNKPCFNVKEGIRDGRVVRAIECIEFILSDEFGPPGQIQFSQKFVRSYDAVKSD